MSPGSPAVAPSVVAAPPPAAPAPVYTPVPGQETRLRVAVKLSVRDPNLVIARPLPAGEAPPPGTREALLILFEPGADPANAPPTSPYGGQTP
jgi:hypothetical protein